MSEGLYNYGLRGSCIVIDTVMVQNRLSGTTPIFGPPATPLRLYIYSLQALQVPN